MKALADNLWTNRCPMRLIGVDMQRSYALIRHDDSLTLLSPTETLEADPITALGKVAHIVAPTRFHDTGMRHAAALFPQATLWGVPGISQMLPELQIKELTTQTTPKAWSNHLRCIEIAGMPKVREHVLWHEQSATLLTSDLIFNIHPPTDSWTKLFFKINGAWEQPAPTRLFRTLIRDRKAFAQSIQTLKALPIQRIIPAHGEPIDTPEGIAHTFKRLEQISG